MSPIRSLEYYILRLLYRTFVYYTMCFKYFTLFMYFFIIAAYHTTDLISNDFPVELLRK